MSPLALAARLRGTGDVLLAAGALGAVSLLVAPVPPWLLDLGLAASLALSAAVLVAALLAREPLRLSALPSLLLFSTLLRLALSVASTRLVLARGEAGRVVQAFGEVLVGGSPVAGAVVFAILSLVQLLVVAKGAERVAEVAARFALDALPGKQMSIDADLRNGAIDGAEARRRRRALEREGQLHGAMDGALKFVKGDAVAGVAIVLVNGAGGLCAGLFRGLELEAAARRYLLLAVGDGLAAQLPGLLVAVAAGVAVTRVAGEEEGTSLASDLGRQLLDDPRALGAVAVLCGGLALLPGLPAAPFLLLGAGAGAAARLSSGSRRRPPPLASEATAPELRRTDPVVLELASDLHRLAAGAGGFLAEAAPLLREAVWQETGLELPDLAIREAPLRAGAWQLLLDDLPVAAGRAEPERALALTAPEELRLVGIAALPARHPLTGARAALVAAAELPRARALGPVLEPLDRVLAGAAAGLCHSLHLLVGVEEAQGLLASLEERAPALAREAARLIPPALLAEVLRRLVEEGVPVRALRRVVEAILEAGTSRPAWQLAEHCRRALGRHLAHRLSGGGPLEVLLLDPEAEARIRAALAAGGPALDPLAAAALLDRIASEAETAEGTPVLLTGPEVRRAVRELVAPRLPRLAVLAYDELPPDWPVRPRARIALAA